MHTVQSSIATLTTTILLRYSKLDQTTFYGVIYAIVLSLVDSDWESLLDKVCNTLNNISTVNQIILTSLVILFAVIYLFYGIGLLSYIALVRRSPEKYINIYFYDQIQIEKLLIYLSKQANVEKNVDICVGDVELLLNNSEMSSSSAGSTTPYVGGIASKITPCLNKTIKFQDSILGIKGTIEWKQTSRTIDIDLNGSNSASNGTNHKQKKLYLKYCILSITRILDFNCKNPHKKKAKKQKHHNENNDIDSQAIVDAIMNVGSPPDIVSLKYIKVLVDPQNSHSLLNHNTTFFSGEKKSVEETEKIYMTPFFHKEKDRLWNMIKKIDSNPEEFHQLGQAAYINLLLYGPPGTGKSTFTYRIARSLYRHIISLDLSIFNKKADVYQVLQRPNVPPLDSNRSCYQNVVFVLEEFDYAIETLSAKKTKRLFNSLCKNKEKRPQEDKETEDEKKEILTPERFEDYGQERNDTDLTVNDLLELLQGPVPLEGSIVIATTNNFDNLQRNFPALVRPGRLTPIHFGYVTPSDLQDISKFYFCQKLSIYIPQEIRIPTSQIIELAKEHRLNNTGFKNFSNALEKLFQQS